MTQSEANLKSAAICISGKKSSSAYGAVIDLNILEANVMDLTGHIPFKYGKQQLLLFFRTTSREIKWFVEKIRTLFAMVGIWKLSAERQVHSFEFQLF